MVDNSLRNICIGISIRYEIGVDKDHVHFLIQSVPMYSSTKIIQLVKSITAKEFFRLHSEFKNQLWGGEFWTKGFYVSTVGQHGDESVISSYVKLQGKEKEYIKLHSQSQQLVLFYYLVALLRGSFVTCNYI